MTKIFTLLTVDIPQVFNQQQLKKVNIVMYTTLVHHLLKHL